MAEIRPAANASASAITTAKMLRFRDRLVVVGRIELSAIGAPGALLDGAPGVAQPLGRDAQCLDLADTHHDMPGDDFDLQPAGNQGSLR